MGTNMFTQCSRASDTKLTMVPTNKQKAHTDDDSVSIHIQHTETGQQIWCDTVAVNECSFVWTLILLKSKI